MRTILYRIAHIGRSDQSGKCLGAVRNKNCRASHRDRHSIFYGLVCSALWPILWMFRFRNRLVISEEYTRKRSALLTTGEET